MRRSSLPGLKKFLLITLSSLLLHGTAFSCKQPQFTIEQAFQQADEIFSGKVENIQYLDSPEQEYPDPRIIVTLSVTRTWKGTAQVKLQLHTTHNKHTCNGYAFTAGEHYLVFARYNSRKNFLGRLSGSDKQTLGVKKMEGTRLLKDAEQDIQWLEKQVR